MGTKRYNRAGYDNEETPRQGQNGSERPRTVGKGDLGSGYAEKAAEAIRRNKERNQKALEELGL